MVWRWVVLLFMNSSQILLYCRNSSVVTEGRVPESTFFSKASSVLIGIGNAAFVNFESMANFLILPLSINILLLWLS